MAWRQLRSGIVASSGGGFTLTAGRIGLNNEIGYGKGSYGSIDQEPIPGNDLSEFYYLLSNGSGIIYFEGDVTSELSGLTVWVDNTEYPFDSDWTYSGGADETQAEWNAGNAPVFSDGVDYSIEIK